MLSQHAVESFELGALPADDRWDAWRDVLTETHLPWDMPGPISEVGTTDAWVRRLQVGEAATIVDCGCDPCAGTRRQPEISATPGSFVAVLMNLGGSEVLEQDGRMAQLTPGELLIWDSERPADFRVLSRLHKRTLLLPRDEVFALCPGASRLTAVALRDRSPAAKLFTSMVASIVDSHADLDLYASASARTATVELLRAVLRPDGPASTSALRAGLHARAVECAERRLSDSRLTPTTLAAQLGVSLRTLQLAFADQEDSPANFLRRRRLERARADLVTNPDGYITEVALRWGFGDSGHFTRAFRREFGLTPREVRERAIVA